MSDRELKITVDTSSMTIGDLEKLDEIQRDNGDISTLLDLLERFVTVEGYDSIRSVPVAYMNDIVDAISSTLGGGGNEKKDGMN